MSGWWSEITLLEKIFWYFAVPFSVLFIIQLIFTIIGMGDSDSDSVDIDIDDGDADIDDLTSSFHFFNIRNFIAFFTVFGWTGITMARAGAGPFATLFVAVVAGIAMMFVVAALFYFIMRLSESGNIDMKRAIGLTGKVYIPIPGKGEGLGKIHITFQGAYREVDAISMDEAFPTGTLVKVVDIMDNNVLVVEKTYKEGW